MAAAASTASEASALGGALFGPAEVEPKTDEGGGLEAPATRPSWLRRTRLALRQSAWTQVLLKLLGLAVAMIALSGVGTLSIMSGVKGTPVPLANLLGADLGAGWLSGQPASGQASGAPASAQVAAAHIVGTDMHGPAGGHASAGAFVPAGGLLAATALTPEANREGIEVTGNGSPGLTADGKVILNLATADDLRHLPGVGQKRADAILALRTRLGRFKQVSDLLRVKGIGVRGLKKIVPHVVLDAAKPAV